MITPRSSLRIGERALFVGIPLCGEIHRLDVRRFAARDKRWRPLGVFATERAVRAAIVRSNRTIDAAEAAQKAAILLAEQRQKAAAARRRHWSYSSIRIPVGAALRLNGPVHFSEIRHVGRRRYFAVNAAGDGVGQFTNQHHALEALAAKPERRRRRRASSSNAD